MTQLVIATRNRKKLKELRKLLRGLPVKIKGLHQLNKRIPKIKEDKDTFIANAKKKALVISRLVKDALVIADDSGLVVDYLDGAPGVNSARYAGLSQNDNKNVSKLLKNMKGVNTQRRAFFNCSVVIAKGGRAIGTVEEMVYGTIAKERYGSSGFGYDPVFIPKGYKKTFAQMKPAFKNKISHRAKALREAKIIIQRYLREYP